MDNQLNLHAFLIKLRNRLSVDGRGPPRILFDDSTLRELRVNPSLNNTLNLLESQFDEGKINNQDFNHIIEAFREIGCQGAAERLGAYQQKKYQETPLILLEDSPLTLIGKSENAQTTIPSASFRKSQQLDSIPVSDSHHPLLSSGVTVMINDKYNKTRRSILKRCSRYRLFFLIFNIVGVLAILLLLILLLTSTKCSKTVPILPTPKPSDGICATATWTEKAITVAGGNGDGPQLSQLSYPTGLFVDANQSIYVADRGNHRIVKWDHDVSYGKRVAGGKGQGNSSDKLNYPRDLIVDDNGTMYISDSDNRRVQRWFSGAESGETIIDDVNAYGIAQDNQGSFYLVNDERNEVKKWVAGETIGQVVISDLKDPFLLFVDQNQSIFVADGGNHRVIKKDSEKGQISIIGSGGHGNGTNQLNGPESVFVDQLGTIYVADSYNHRIMRWPLGATSGTIIAGGHGKGYRSDQLNIPTDLSFDKQGNLYVCDFINHRVQKFTIHNCSC